MDKRSTWAVMREISRGLCLRRGCRKGRGDGKVPERYAGVIRTTIHSV